MTDLFETTQTEAARRYRKRATELRQQAEVAATARLRGLLLENAELYDKLAAWAEHRAQDRRKPLP